MTFKISINIEDRPGGGLRVWSPDIKGLVLSHPDKHAVLSDIGPALRVMLDHSTERNRDGEFEKGRSDRDEL